MASVAVSCPGVVAGKLASWAPRSSGKLPRKRPSSNFEVFLVVVSGHRDRMLSIRTASFSEPRGGRLRRSLTFCMSDLPYARHRHCFSSV